MEPAPKKQPESIALRAFDVLEHLINAEAPSSLDDITHACRLPKPTVYRILKILQRGGLLLREPIGKRYSIGPRLSAIALQVLSNSTLRAQRHAIISQLVDEIGETCNFNMLDGNEVIYVDRVETSSPVRLHLEPGTRVPLHCTASGKLFLSQLSMKQLHRLIGKGPLQRYTDKTVTEVHILEKELKRIKEARVSTDRGERFEESVGIAVPITDGNGRMYAALAAHGPSYRMPVEAGLKHVPALRRAADEIAALLLRKPAQPET